MILQLVKKRCARRSATVSCETAICVCCSSVFFSRLCNFFHDRTTYFRRVCSSVTDVLTKTEQLCNGARHSMILQFCGTVCSRFASMLMARNCCLIILNCRSSVGALQRRRHISGAAQGRRQTVNKPQFFSSSIICRTAVAPKTVRGTDWRPVSYSNSEQLVLPRGWVTYARPADPAASCFFFCVAWRDGLHRPI